MKRIFSASITFLALINTAHSMSIDPSVFTVGGVGRTFEAAERDMARAASRRCENGLPILKDQAKARDIGTFKDVTGQYFCDQSAYQKIVVCTSQSSTIEVLTNFRLRYPHDDRRKQIVYGVLKITAPRGVEVHDAFINNMFGTGDVYLVAKLNNLVPLVSGFTVPSFFVYADGSGMNVPLNLEGSNIYHCSTAGSTEPASEQF